MQLTNIKAGQEWNEERFTKRMLFANGDSSCAFVLNFQQGQELPAHRHPGSDVYLLALQGNGTCEVDGQSQPFAQGDVLYCNGEEKLRLANDGDEPFSVYVVLSQVPDPAYAKNV